MSIIPSLAACSESVTRRGLINTARISGIQCVRISGKLGVRISGTRSLGIAQRHVMLLEQRVDLKACVEFKQPTDLSLGQRTCSIALYGNGLERAPRHVCPMDLRERRKCPPASVW